MKLGVLTVLFRKSVALLRGVMPNEPALAEAWWT